GRPADRAGPRGLHVGLHDAEGHHRRGRGRGGRLGRLDVRGADLHCRARRRPRQRRRGGSSHRGRRSVPGRHGRRIRPGDQPVGLPEDRGRAAALELRQEGNRAVEDGALASVEGRSGPPARVAPPGVLRQSPIWTPAVIEDIQTKAELGHYRIRGLSALRRVPNFDDLVFIPGTLSRMPLEGYRERCDTRTVLGTRFAKRPIGLETPITITGMSFGALSRNAKVALARAATRLGISTTTGDGGMLPAEREHSARLVYQVLPSRYGFNPHHLR